MSVEMVSVSERLAIVDRLEYRPLDGWAVAALGGRKGSNTPVVGGPGLEVAVTTSIPMTRRTRNGDTRGLKAGIEGSRAKRARPPAVKSKLQWSTRMLATTVTGQHTYSRERTAGRLPGTDYSLAVARELHAYG